MGQRMHVPGQNPRASGLFGSGAAPGSAAGPATLEGQRELMFSGLQAGYAPWQGALGQQLQASLQGALAGGGPYTPEVVNNLLGRQETAIGGQRASDVRQAHAFYLSQGLEGGGGELSALTGASRRASAALQQARNQIDVTAALENYQAQERAQQRTSEYFASRAQAEAPYRLKEADLRSHFQVTTPSSAINLGYFNQQGPGGGYGGAGYGGGGGGYGGPGEGEQGGESGGPGGPYYGGAGGYPPATGQPVPGGAPYVGPPDSATPGSGSISGLRGTYVIGPDGRPQRIAPPAESYKPGSLFHSLYPGVAPSAPAPSQPTRIGTARRRGPIGGPGAKHQNAQQGYGVLG